MGLASRVSAALAAQRAAPSSRSELSMDDYAAYFNFAGMSYPVIQTTLGSVDRERVGMSATGAYLGSSPAFALVQARIQVFSQVRFQWTRLQGSQPGDLFGTPELAVLEKPWPNGSTSALLARMEVDGSLAGNAYIVRARPGRLSRLRPEFVTIILGSETDANDPADAPDCQVAAYMYTPPSGREQIFFPEQIAHWAPVPNPYYHFLGMSWLTPVIRELQGDTLATEHKIRFYENAASPNMVIRFDPSVDIMKVKAFKELMEDEHRGAFNAWRTLYLGGGADPVPIGFNFQQMDYAALQGKAESRLAAAAGVPPSWVGFSEGLQGSALNAGNFNTARRRFSDGLMWNLWQTAATALENVLDVPDGANLWPDTRVPFMRQDEGDAALIQQQQAATIGSLITQGFTADSAVRAVQNNDWSVLVHTGMVSVQLQRPGGQGSGPAPLPPSPPGEESDPQAPLGDEDDAAPPQPYEGDTPDE